MGLLGVVNLSFNIANRYEINELREVMKDHSKAIANINFVNEQQTKRINLVIEGLDVTNKLLEKVHYDLQVTAQLFNIKLVLDNIEAELDFLVGEIRRDIQNVIHAADGKMTPDILPFGVLWELLIKARETKGFIPLFNEDSLAFYYPIMEVSVTLDSFVVSVPMGAFSVFQAYRIHPFPTNVDGNTLIMKLENDLVLISADHKMMAESHSNQLSNCKRVLDLIICLGSAFMLKGLESQDICTRRLILGLSNVFSCSYYEEEVSVRFLQTNRFTYLFTREPTPITVSCNGAETVTKMVKGVQRLHRGCDVNSKHYHVAGYNKLSFTIGRRERTHKSIVFSNLVPYNYTVFKHHKIELLQDNVSQDSGANWYNIVSVSMCLFIVIALALLGCSSRWVHKWCIRKITMMLEAAVAAGDVRGVQNECGGTSTDAADEAGQRAIPGATAGQLAVTVRHTSSDERE